MVTWSDLRKLNYKTGEMPESIRKLTGKPIKIPGFAVPLEGDDGFEYVKEFLLVPTLWYVYSCTTTTTKSSNSRNFR